MIINSLLDKLKNFCNEEDDFELVNWEFADDPEYEDCLCVKLYLGEKENKDVS